MKISLPIYVLLFFIYKTGSSGLFAQSADGGLVNNGATIVISSGTHMVVSGGSDADYIVSGNGELNLEGTLSIEGDWINNNATSDGFTAENGTGTVLLAGTQNNMVIGGSQVTNFEGLTINRASANVNVNQNTTVVGTLTLTNGILSTGANYISCTSNATGAVSGGSTGSFVNGNLRRAVTTSTLYDFPVGDGTTTTNYHKASITTGATFSGVTALTTSVNEATPSGNNTEAQLFSANITEDGSWITSMAVNGAGDYVEWDISPVAGALGGGSSYTVDLYLNDLTASLTDDKFTVLKRSSSSTDFADYASFDATTTIPSAGAAGRTIAGGYARKSGFSAFSKFMIGKSANVLPVELTDFYSACKDEKLVLNWQTASESNNDYFVIEQSQNGQEFNSVGILYPSTSNSNQTTNYTFTEAASLNGYFRLKQVDLNGSVNYSAIIYSSGCKSRDVISAFVFNSGNENIIVDATKLQANHTYLFSVIDMAGKLIYESIFPISNEQKQVQIPIHKIATATYLIQITDISNEKMFIDSH